MAFQQTAHAIPKLEAQPQSPEYPAQQDPQQRNTTKRLMEELLDRSQASRKCQKDLEFRLQEEHAHLQQERQHSSRLEQQLADLQWTHTQVKSALRQTTSDVNWLRQELDVQTRKSQDAESQAVALASLNQSLLKMLFDSVSAEGGDQPKLMDILQMYSDIQKHSESIAALHRSNKYLEESIEALQAAFQESLFAGSYSGSSHSSDSSTIIEQGGGVEVEYPFGLSTRGGTEPRQIAPGGLPKERSWYEE